ncbi:MAG: HAD-IB family hydrolase [Gammaproteobacteria bacterium]|nr:HAD-IB family hydrolase [Gammaproteobacteria bacterium]MDH3371420.1 HAD-IB family hydrolase [Gammaproteobacteria bacterium]MDH3407034.1 HAD-IB family hydrolase [Gammaproteobacteria bacterium]MDH5487049.1 HAD-IB family hydrolase [Gammaproteobacteria bacterium]
MSLAIFDLDNTLLRGDSDYAWGRFLVENRIVDGEEYERENERYYKQYQAGTLDILEFLAFALRPLSQHDRVTLDGWHRQYMHEKILPMIAPAARALVEKHRRQGDTLVIITATNRFVTAPIAREFNIDHLIATEPEERQGRYTGKVDGTPCYREGKVTRLNNWIQQHRQTLKGSWFYSDSHNDLPLLSIVDHPVAVDPDETLRVEAGLRGWEIISLR